MKINHRISARNDAPFWAEIERLGIPFDRDTDSGMIIALEITEEHPKWPEVSQLCSAYKDLVILDNCIFSRQELDSAHYLKISAKGHHGYPQPEDEYRSWTYDLTHYCLTCGIGGIQKAPFRLRAEPKALHSHFIQLNWVYDEYFIRHEVRQALLDAKITGIEFEAPLLHKSNLPSNAVTQMKVVTVLPPGMANSDLVTAICGRDSGESQSASSGIAQTKGANTHCGRIKYLDRAKLLKFSYNALDCDVDVVKSYEWFGTGACGVRHIIVSQRFRQVIMANKWRGLNFEPIEIVGAPA